MTGRGYQVNTTSKQEARKRQEQILALPSMVVLEPAFKNGINLGSRVGIVVAAMPVLHYIRRLPWVTFDILRKEWYLRALQTAALRMANPRNENERGNQPVLFWSVRTSQITLFSTVSFGYQEAGVGPNRLVRVNKETSNGKRRVSSERTSDDLIAFLQERGRPDQNNAFRLTTKEAWARFLYLPRKVPLPVFDPYEKQDPMMAIRMIQAYHLDWAVLNGEISPAQARRIWPEMSRESRLEQSPIQDMQPQEDRVQ
jgi:hypothetical protein